MPAQRARKLNALVDRVTSVRKDLGRLEERVDAIPAAAPGGEGTPLDPGDLTVYFDNALI